MKRETNHGMQKNVTIQNFGSTLCGSMSKFHC